jgi:geranylgeranyl pyrophosphate synthase
VLIAFETAAGSDAETLRRFYGRESDDVTSLLEILERCRARNASQGELDAYLNRALDALHEAQLPMTYEAELAALAREYTGQVPLTT